MNYLTICLNPVLQKTLILESLDEDRVNRSSEYYQDASGKGVNVTRVLYQLGEEALHLTHLGAGREQFLKMAEQDGVHLRWVKSSSPIRSCYTLLSRRSRTSTEIVEEGEPVSPGTEEAVLAEFDRLIDRFGALIISGSKAPGYSDGIFPRMVRTASDKGKLTVLDFRRKDLLACLPCRPGIIKPNLTEFAETFFPGEIPAEKESDPDVLDRIREKMEELYSRYSVRTILTRGSRPVLYFDGSSHGEEPVHPVTPVNTIGCGDSFTAGLASALGRGGSLAEAVREGNRCAALNACRLKPGSID